jgi:hypothetical protein
MVKRILVKRTLGEVDKDLRELVSRVLPEGLAI